MTGPLRDDWRVTVGVISGGHFFSHFYLLALPPLFPLLRGEFGLNNTQLGLIVSVLAVGGLLQAPVGGIVDRVGAKWVFVAGLGASAGGIAVVGLGPSYPAILALTALSGLGQSAFHPADYAMINAVTDSHLVGRAFSFHTFSGITGFAAAPVVVGSLGLAVGWRVTLVLVGLVGLAYAVFAAFALGRTDRAAVGMTRGRSSTDPPRERAFRAALARPGILAMFGFFLTIAVAGKGVQTFTTILAIDTYGLGESTGNTLLTAFFSFGAIGVLVGGVLADRYPPGRVIAGTLLVGSGLLFLTLGVEERVGPLALVGLFAAIGFFTTLVAPSRDRLVSDLSATGTMGQTFGIVFTGGTIGGLAGPVLLGAISDAVSVTVSFVVIGGFYLAAGLLAITIARRWLAPESTGSSA